MTATTGGVDGTGVGTLTLPRSAVLLVITRPFSMVSTRPSALPVAAAAIAHGAVLLDMRRAGTLEGPRLRVPALVPHAPSLAGRVFAGLYR